MDTEEKAYYDDLKGRLGIDILRLDDELMEHPVIMQQVIEGAADSIYTRDAAKNDLDVITAMAARKLRNIDIDGKPPSEKRLESLVLLDKEVIRQSRLYEEAKRDYAYWSGLVDSFTHKGGSLKRISELTIAGYLAPNQVRRDELTKKRRES